MKTEKFLFLESQIFLTETISPLWKQLVPQMLVLQTSSMYLGCGVVLLDLLISSFKTWYLGQRILKNVSHSLCLRVCFEKQEGTLKGYSVCLVW